MPLAVAAVLFVFWIAMAYRAYERGDMLMAGIFALVGIVMTVYRAGIAKKLAEASKQKSA